MGKRFLFIFRSPPRAGHEATEILDMALTAAAFDQPVTLLFLEDGVLQLRPKAPAADGSGAMAPDFGLLSMYEVQAIQVERESLEARGLSERDLTIPVAVIGRSEVSRLVAAQDVVVSG